MHDVLNSPDKSIIARKRRRLVNVAIVHKMYNCCGPIWIRHTGCPKIIAKQNLGPKNHNENQDAWGHGHDFGPLDPT